MSQALEDFREVAAGAGENVAGVDAARERTLQPAGWDPDWTPFYTREENGQWGFRWRLKEVLPAGAAKRNWPVHQRWLIQGGVTLLPNWGHFFAVLAFKSFRLYGGDFFFVLRFDGFEENVRDMK